MSNLKARIRFLKPTLAAQNGELPVSPDTSLMRALIDAGIAVASSCGGEGVCTKCRLTVRALEPGALPPPSSFEKGLLQRIRAHPDERLSCQTKILGLVEVDAGYW